MQNAAHLFCVCVPHLRPFTAIHHHHHHQSDEITVV